MKTWILNRIRKSASKSYLIESFDELFLDVYLLTYLVRAAASIFSLVTGFYFLYTLFGAQLDGVSKYILASVTVIVVESLKYYITPKAFSNLFKKNLTYGLPTLMVAIPLYLVSVFFTINGVGQYFDDNNDAIEIAVSDRDVAVSDKIAYYDSLIRVEQLKYDKVTSQHEGTSRMGWKAVIDQLDKIETRIDEYIDEKEVIRAETKEDQNKVVETTIEETNFIKQNTIYISAASESLLFLAFLFSQYYLYRAFVDAKRLPKTKTKKVVISVPKLGAMKRPTSQAADKAKVDRTQQIRDLIKDGVVAPKEIAERLGTHPNYVRKILKEIGA